MKKLNKQELIKHCERQIQCLFNVKNNRYFEHLIFLHLLNGGSVDDLFNKEGEFREYLFEEDKELNKINSDNDE